MSEKIAFVGWNPFQFRHIEQIAQELPGCFYILEKKKNNIEQFDKKLFSKHNVNVITWPSEKMYKLDGVFDYIVCQVPFNGIEKFQKSKIAFIQYGYAKDPHNYGLWRALADINFTYGKYASDRIKQFTDVCESGNPECEKWLSKKFHSESIAKYSRILENKKTILYAPTWGDLSSVDEYIYSIITKLHFRFNIILKLHHNTDLIEKHRQELKNIPNIHIAGANDDIWELLCVSDILISDYSGAIFDGVYAEIPIILLNTKNAINSKKEDIYSLEILHRGEIGVEVNSADSLDKIEYLYNKAVEIRDRHQIKKKLFTDCEQPAKIIARELLARISSPRTKPQIQRYINEYVRKTYVESKKK